MLACASSFGFHVVYTKVPSSLSFRGKWLDESINGWLCQLRSFPRRSEYCSVHCRALHMVGQLHSRPVFEFRPMTKALRLRRMCRSVLFSQLVQCADYLQILRGVVCCVERDFLPKQKPGSIMWRPGSVRQNLKVLNVSDYIVSYSSWLNIHGRRYNTWS